MELMLKNKCSHLKNKILWHLSENFLTHPHIYMKIARNNINFINAKFSFIYANLNFNCANLNFICA